jgi:hypothetical protein
MVWRRSWLSTPARDMVAIIWRATQLTLNLFISHINTLMQLLQSDARVAVEGWRSSWRWGTRSQLLCYQIASYVKKKGKDHVSEIKKAYHLLLQLISFLGHRRSALLSSFQPTK